MTTHTTQREADERALSTEQLLQVIARNTPGRINLNLGDLDMYLMVMRALSEKQNNA